MIFIFRDGHQLIVPPDQLVGPALKLASAIVQGKHIALQTGIFFSSRLIHLLDNLKGQDDLADFISTKNGKFLVRF